MTALTHTTFKKDRDMLREPRFTAIGHIVLVLMSLAAVIPFLLLMISSLTDNSTIVRNGYSFFPERFSLEAYEYLFSNSNQIFRAYGITIFTTLLGTALNLTISTLLAYPLSRKDFMFNKVLSFMVVFSILFRGGMVPTYLVYTTIFNIKNTIWGQIMPSLMNGFYVLLIRSYFSTNIPMEIIEAAKIDGATEVRSFWSAVLPLSVPILASIGLLVGISFWNNWYNGLLFITDRNLKSIQNILNSMMSNIQYLTSGASGADVKVSTEDLPSYTVQMAIGVVGALPIIVIYPFFKKFFVKGIALGAVKG